MRSLRPPKLLCWTGLLLHVLLSSAVAAQVGDSSHVRSQPDSASGPYFYRGLGYGSDAQMGPLAVVLNKGFAASQADGLNHGKLIGRPYGLVPVNDALLHPLRAIERSGGAWEFLRKEILPLTFKGTDAKWSVNYAGHLIEGGIHWRRLKEWFDSRGVPQAGLISAITTMGAAYLNEVYENGGAEFGNSSTVADLYIFDLASILLFSVDGVSRFFANALHANVWTGQASITVPAVHIENVGNYLHFKLPSPIRNSSVFFWTGFGVGLGLTAHRPGGLDLSVAAGVDTRAMRRDPETGEETVDFRLSLTAFLDRNGSLLTSLHLSQIQNRLIKLNVYPGVLRPFGGDFGTWLVVSRDFHVRFGISSRHWFGTGFGFGRERTDSTH